MGSTHERDSGLEPKKVTVGPFAIDKTAVTNKQFREFVKDTKYQSDSQKYKWSFVLE